MTRLIASLSDEALDALRRLADRRRLSPDELLERLVRDAAIESGILEPPEEPFLALEAVEEIPAIGPEGRGRRVHLKAIDETGEQDLGDLFVPDGRDNGEKEKE